MGANSSRPTGSLRQRPKTQKAEREGYFPLHENQETKQKQVKSLTDADHYFTLREPCVASLRSDRHQIGLTDRHHRNAQYSFLNSFFAAPVVYKGVTYATTEHAFQAQKTLDPEEQEYVRTATTPGKAKGRGHAVTRRPDSDQIRFDIMLEIVREEFVPSVLAPLTHSSVSTLSSSWSCNAAPAADIRFFCRLVAPNAPIRSVPPL